MRDDELHKDAPPSDRDEEDGLPQPDGNRLDVVTTSPEDGRSGPRLQRAAHMRPGGLAADDPFWTFGTPPDTWGSSVRRSDGEGSSEPRSPRPRAFLECRTCGVKMEQKRAHGTGRIPCPMCGRWMQQSRPA